jgi:hypothetical protein
MNAEAMWGRLLICGRLVIGLRVRQRLPEGGHVDLRQQGAGLPDPHGLLKGTGKVVRIIRLESAEGLDKPAIRELIAVALQNAKRPIDPKAQGKLVVKSISSKQLPRRPA